MNRSEKISDSHSEQKAKRFKIYKWLVLGLLVLFLLGGLVLFENDITVENLRYLVQYLDFSGVGSYSEETVIHYNADAANQFYVFRGDLVLVNEKSITLYDRRGTPVMTDSFNMTQPLAVPSEKYLVLYDLGASKLRVYNSFSLLFEKDFDYLIQSVSVNNDGDFCVVTSEKSYHSSVYVYNDDFEEIHHWRSATQFAVDASLSDHGVLTVSTIQVEAGELIARLIEMKVGKQEEISTYVTTDLMPLTHSTDRAGTLCLTDETLDFVKGGERINSVAVSGDALRQIRFGEQLTVLVQSELSVGVNVKMRVFDREGKELYSKNFSVPIRDVEIRGENVYVLTHTHLYLLSLGEEMREFALAGDYSDLGVLSRDAVVLCSETSANIRILN